MPGRRTVPASPARDTGQMVAGMEAYQSAGVDHLVLALNSGDIPGLRSVMETIARDVIPQFR